jgi:hypothetical protein
LTGRQVAGRARKRYDEAAKKRQKAGGGDRKSAKAKSVPVNLPEPILPEPIRAGDARDLAAQAAGLGGGTVFR